MDQSLKKKQLENKKWWYDPQGLYFPSSIYFHQLVPYKNGSTTSQNSTASWGTRGETHKSGWGH